MNILLAWLPLLAFTPSVDSVSTSQDAAGKVSVTYTLTAPAIVTIGMETNTADGWLPVKCVSSTYGAVNKAIRTNGVYTAYWEAERDLPGVRLSENARMTVKAWSMGDPPDYLVADLTMETNLMFYAYAESLPGGATNDAYKTDKLAMRRIHAANVIWTQGSYDDVGRNVNNENQQSVMLTNDYYIGIYPLTQAQFWRARGFSGSKTFANNHSPWCQLCPIESTNAIEIRGANWTRDNMPEVTATSFIGKFRARTGLALDLPTSAQWEFACRAGTTSALYDGNNLKTWDNDVNVGRLAWYTDNCFEDPNYEGVTDKSTHVVGLKEPNSWGLYDMLGNVWEVCLDWYALTNSCQGGVLIDPRGPAESAGETTDHKYAYVWHGGCFNEGATSCRSAKVFNWDYQATSAGYRLIAPIDIKLYNEGE